MKKIILFRLSFIYFSLLVTGLNAQHNMLLNVAYSKFGFAKPMAGVYGEVILRTKGFEFQVDIPYYDYSLQVARDLKDNTDKLKGFRHFRGGLTSSLWSGAATQKTFTITGSGFKKDGAGNYQGSDGQRYSYYTEGYTSFQDCKASFIMSFGVDYLRTAARPDIERNYSYSNVNVTSGYLRFFYGKTSNLYSSGGFVDFMYSPSITFSTPESNGVKYPIVNSGDYKNRPLGFKIGYEFYGKYFSTTIELGTIPGVSKNRFLCNISVGFPLKF